jgi:hypothetical protein
MSPGEGWRAAPMEFNTRPIAEADAPKIPHVMIILGGKHGNQDARLAGTIWGMVEGGRRKQARWIPTDGDNGTADTLSAR